MESELEKSAHINGNVCVRSKKERRKRQKILVIELLFDYAKNSTLHGLRYIVDRGLRIIERLFWFITVVASIGICGYFIYNMFEKWRTSPVIVTVNGQLTSVGTVPFPAVTICPQIKVKAMVYNYTEAYAKFINKSLHGRDLIKFEHIDTMCEAEFCQLNLTTTSLTNVSLVRDITEVAPTLDDITLACVWLDVEVNCSNLFSRVYTEEGVCYVANSLAAKDIFEKSVQSEYYYLESDNSSVGWSPETGYNDSVIYPYPRRGHVVGSLPDMTLILIHDPSHRDKSCNGLYSGYKIFLHHPADFPQSTLYYYAALPNQVTSLAVSFHQFNTDASLLSYIPEIRQCYFPIDRKLRYFKIYTDENCQAECLSNYTFVLCGCVGFFMPHDNSSQLCAPGEDKCISRAKNLMARGETRLGIEQGCQCLPACNTIEYDAEILKSEFNLRERLKNNPDFNQEHSYSRIDLYFKKSEFVTMQRRELFGVTDLLANIGGLLGLFLGFSFLSLIEIVYFLTFRVGVALKRDLEEEKLQKKATSEVNIIMD